MAFRKIEPGDHVKVKKGEHFGQFGVVTNTVANRIQVQLKHSGEVWLNSDELLIANPDNYVYVNRMPQVESTEEVEEDPYEQFDGWDREDLMDTILRLRKKLDEV